MEKLVRHDQHLASRRDPALGARRSVRLEDAVLVLVGAFPVRLFGVRVVGQRVADLNQDVVEADRPFRVCKDGVG
jgi:hypothetical protein